MFLYHAGLLTKSYTPRELKVLAISLRYNPTSTAAAALYLFNCGEFGEAVDLFTQAVRVAANNPQEMIKAMPAISSMLFHCHCHGLPQDMTTYLHRLWGDAAAHIMPKMPRILYREGRRLRIGYLTSNSYLPHPSNYFTNSAIGYHDRQRFETFIFDSTGHTSKLPLNPLERIRQRSHANGIKRSAEHYRDVSTLDDIALAELIHGLGIDVLVDPDVHMNYGRPLVLAMFGGIKIIAGAYPSTSGLTENAYLLGDRYHTPEEFSHLYTETIIRLKAGLACFVPPEQPRITPSPAALGGPVTFSMFNYQNKTCAQYLGLIEGILQALPDSRLLVGAGLPWQMEALRGKLSAYGARVEYIPTCRRSKFVKQWERVDINLDPVWYSGSTTTLEAMLHGVPTITLAGGQRACQRHSYAFNSLTGHPELIAGDEAEYIRLACDLAGDQEQLKAYRREMGQQVMNSVGDCRVWMQEFETVIEGLCM